MSSATMKLLQKGGKAKTEEPVEIAETDIEEMTVKQMKELYDQKLEAGDIAPIDKFSTLSAAAKRKALVKAIDNGAAKEEPEESKEVAKSGASTAGAPKSAKGNMTILGKNPITDASHEIDQMDEAEAHNAVNERVDRAAFDDFYIGGVLARIQANGWFDGQENFRGYIETHTNLQYRKAVYLTQIYNTLVETEVPWDEVKDLGWTKIMHLLPVLGEKGYKSWVKKAHKMTALALSNEIKAATKPETLESGKSTTSEVSTMTFKVHEDQRETINLAIEQAKEAAETDVNTVALEFICLEYAANSTTTKKPKIKEMTIDDVFAKIKEDNDDLEDQLDLVFTSFQEYWPDVNIKVSIEE